MRIKAFTIVELLVIVAILSILIAILLPALAAARKAANDKANPPKPLVVQGIVISKVHDADKKTFRVEMQTVTGEKVAFSLFPHSDPDDEHYRLHKAFYEKLIVGKAYVVKFEIDPQVVKSIQDLPEGVVD